MTFHRSVGKFDPNTDDTITNNVTNEVKKSNIIFIALFGAHINNLMRSPVDDASTIHEKFFAELVKLVKKYTLNQSHLARHSTYLTLMSKHPMKTSES